MDSATTNRQWRGSLRAADLRRLPSRRVGGERIVLDRPQGILLGLVTLHDLLRAQMALAQGGRE